MSKVKNHAMTSGHDDNTVTSRALIAFVFTFFVVFLLMQAYRIFDQMVGALAFIDLLWVLTAVFSGCFVLLVIWSCFISVRKSKRFGSLSLSLNLCLLFFLATVSCAVMALYHLEGVLFLYAALPAAALLYLIYYIYQREFFALALCTGGTILVLWLCSRWQDLHPFRILCLGIGAGVLLLLLGALAALLSKADGVLSLAGRKIRLLPAGALYGPLLISLPLCAVVCLVFTFLPFLAFSAMLALCAYLFLLAVYFTVKMM